MLQSQIYSASSSIPSTAGTNFFGPSGKITPIMPLPEPMFHSASSRHQYKPSSQQSSVPSSFPFQRKSYGPVPTFLSSKTEVCLNSVF